MALNPLEKHDYYMDLALKQANRSLALAEVPVGAVVVDKDGNIIGRGRNQPEKRKCQVAHAEIVAISQACKKIGDWRLEGCSLYVSLEPCVMCFGLIKLSRIKMLVYGASSPLFGFSNYLSDSIVKKMDTMIISGLKEEPSIAMLKMFFKQARNKGKGYEKEY